MFCSHCGYQNADENRYCVSCGQKLYQETRSSWKLQSLLLVCILLLGIFIGIRFFGTGETDVPAVSKAPEISQVLPLENGAVAALYTDGTVRVAGNDRFAQAAGSWDRVSRIYYCNTFDWADGDFQDRSYLVGLREDGTVVTTAGDLTGWSQVKKLLVTWEGVIGITEEGRVLVHGNWENAAFLTGLSSVEDLVQLGAEWGCLMKDGSTMFFIDGVYIEEYQLHWQNVAELRASDHGFYAILKDGSVVGQIDSNFEGLRGAAKVVDFEDWLFGISPDGRLLTHNGGSIYTNLGDMMVDVPGLPYYGGEVDIRPFNQVADIVPFSGLILLNEDGSVAPIGEFLPRSIAQWKNIAKVCGLWDGEQGMPTLYGIRRDGSVIRTQFDHMQMDQPDTDQYRGWSLRELYAGTGGVVGLTTEGTLVGDGAYQNTDFSVFAR